MATNKDGFDPAQELTFDQINQYEAKLRQERKNADSKPRQSRATRKKELHRSDKQRPEDTFGTAGTQEAEES